MATCAGPTCSRRARSRRSPEQAVERSPSGAYPWYTASRRNRVMEFETLASGFGLLEAPRVDDQGRMYFSDVPNGGVYRRSPDGKVETVIPKRKGVGGMIFNQSGGLVLTGRGLIHFDDKTGKSRDLFVEWEGK